MMSYVNEFDYAFMIDEKTVANPIILSAKKRNQQNERIKGWSDLKAFMPDYNNFMESVFLTKQQQQDETIEELAQKIEEQSRKIDDINFKVHTIVPKGYNYKEDLPNIILDESIMNSGQTNTISHMIAEVQKLEGLEDSRDQVEYCAHICKSTLELLKKNPVSNPENYCVKVLHLFYQAVKRNYAKALFTSRQVQLMRDMLEECRNGFVEKEKYWEFDERLYDVQLSVFPEED